MNIYLTFRHWLVVRFCEEPWSGYKKSSWSHSGLRNREVKIKLGKYKGCCQLTPFILPNLANCTDAPGRWQQWVLSAPLCILLPSITSVISLLQYPRSFLFSHPPLPLFISGIYSVLKDSGYQRFGELVLSIVLRMPPCGQAVLSMNADQILPHPFTEPSSSPSQSWKCCQRLTHAVPNVIPS